jgi:hypothetical protein
VPGVNGGSDFSIGLRLARAFSEVVPRDAAFAGFDESDEVLDFLDLENILLDPGKRVADGEAFPKHDFIGLAEGVESGVGSPLTIESDFVDGNGLGGISIDKHKGSDVLHDFGATGNHGHFSDPAELMDRAPAADDCAILDEDVPGNSCARDNDIVSEAAIMCDMTAGKDGVA